MSEDMNTNAVEEKECGCGCNSETEKAQDSSCGCNDGAEGCGCGNDHDHHPDVITLTLENDEDVECAVLGIFDVEEQDYIALLPQDSEDVFIYIYNEDAEGNVSLANIESQEAFDKVSEAFLAIIEEDEE